MNIRRLIASFILLAGLASAHSQSYWTLGPTLHLDFGKGRIEPSLGFEVGYWGGGFEFANIGSPIGADVGIEFTMTRWRLYSEAQAGLIAGLSVGPYLELPYSQEPAAFGLQGSIWGAYFAGADLRGRIGTDGRALSPGVFGKFIHCVGGPDYCWN